MDDLERAAVLVNAIEDVLDELRDRDEPALDEHIAELEDLRAETVARLEAAEVGLS